VRPTNGTRGNAIEPGFTSREIRKSHCARETGKARNDAAQASRIDMHVVATDEELMIARHTLALPTARKARRLHATA